MAISHTPSLTGQRVTHVAQLRGTLVARRRALGLSQQALARKLGISQSHLSDIETGQRVLSTDRLLEILNLLGLELLVQSRASTKREW